MIDAGRSDAMARALRPTLAVIPGQTAQSDGRTGRSANSRDVMRFPGRRRNLRTDRPRFRSMGKSADAGRCRC